jgi:HNH endonuclease
MRAEEFVAAAGKPAYLFNWKPEVWDLDELRKRVDEFDSIGATKESWPCNAGKKARDGDGAYLLKMGKPLGTLGKGIFGRGQILGDAVKLGSHEFRVDIEFVKSRGDMLWDPAKHLLVHEEELSRMPRADRFENIQAAGETLNPEAARQIDIIIDDIIIDDSIRRGGDSNPADEAAREVVRLKRLIEEGTRPDQGAFGEKIRRNYRNKCAVTECATSAALQAAHIRILKGADDNSPANGILLRADIHALLDRLLITFTEDGKGIELNSELTDESYTFLRRAVVARPDQGPPSTENIREHRNRFLARQKQIVLPVP